jgi:hypothetical protein
MAAVAVPPLMAASAADGVKSPALEQACLHYRRGMA